MKKLDMCLAALGQSLKIVVLPGVSDPVSGYLPQPRLKSGLFPLASGQDSVSFCTNPSSLHIDGVGFLVSAGQNIEDMQRYSSRADRLALLELSLRCGHLAPTAPDTLCTKPD